MIVQSRLAPARLALIVAMGENRVIGLDGEIPWRLPSDLKHFRALTMGRPMIMGRKTFDSIGRLLDGRDTVIVTRQSGFAAAGAHVSHSVQSAIMLARELSVARQSDEFMGVGGAAIYAELLEQAECIYLTQLHAAPQGDTYFPEFNAGGWRETARKNHAAGPGDEFDFSFITLERKA